MYKTISFAVMHFIVAFAVTYALTGSIVLGGAVALVEPTVNTIGFHIHEKIWQNIEQAKITLGVTMQDNAMAN